jgi:hypothetical protein
MHLGQDSAFAATQPPARQRLMQPNSRQPWTHELGQRLRVHQPLKIVGTTVWIWIFFVGYFH